MRRIILSTIFLFSFIFCLILVCLFFRSNLVSADGNLLAYWKLDETTAGSTVVDSSGNGYDGTPHGAPTPSTDIPSTITFTDPESLSFDGTQWVSVPDNSAFALTNATFSVWVKFTDLTAGDMDMIAKRSSDGSQAQWQFGYNGGGNQFKVSLANNGTNGCCNDYHWTPSPTLLANTWYNVAVAIDNNAHTLKWYQNGVLKQTDDITGSNLGTQISADLTLGASYDGTGEFLKGLLDDVRIYNAALTSDQITDIASGDSGPGVPSPTPSDSISPTVSQNGATQASTPNGPPSCNQSAPVSSPNLFQVTTSTTSATLYFTPVQNSTGYVVSYGLTPSANQYSVFFDSQESSGAIPYTINNLTQNTTYYFKVQPKNGCMPGGFSQVVSGSTTSVETEATQIEKASTPTSSPKSGTISVVNNKQTQTNSSNPNQQGYNLSVTVQNNGQPVPNATVELHSTPMRTVTDKNGVARFSNVEGGTHTILLAYQGFSGQEKINMKGDKKDIAINMSIELHPYPTNPFIISGVAILIIIIFILLFLLVKKRRKPKDK